MMTKQKQIISPIGPALAASSIRWIIIWKVSSTLPRFFARNLQQLPSFPPKLVGDSFATTGLRNKI